MRIILNKIKNRRGVTIIEVIISIYLMSMGMIGLLSLMVQSLQAKKVNTDTVIASMLAQEGLELVRNIRDTNWLNGATGDQWKQGGGAGQQNIVQDGDYIIYFNEPTNAIIINDTINDIGNALLYLDASNYYTHIATTKPSQFSRLITVDDDFDGNGNIEVKCTVRWSVKNSYNEYVATTYLYDWR